MHFRRAFYFLTSEIEFCFIFNGARNFVLPMN